MERLSSGYRVNRAADDAAGLAISERMRSQIRGVAQATRNAQDGISLVQTAEGSLDEVHSMLQRIRELAVQYKNGSLSNNDRAALQSEVNQLASEIERIGSSAEFNGIKVLNGAVMLTFQIGANDSDAVSVSTLSLGSAVGSAVFALSSTQNTDLAQIDSAIDAVSQQRSTFGAIQNRFEHLMNGLSVYHENLVASESRIRDVDMAEEMVSMTKFQILQQAGTSMLAQANQMPQSVLSLLERLGQRPHVARPEPLGSGVIFQREPPQLRRRTRQRQPGRLGDLGQRQAAPPAQRAGHIRPLDRLAARPPDERAQRIGRRLLVVDPAGSLHLEGRERHPARRVVVLRRGAACALPISLETLADLARLQVRSQTGRVDAGHRAKCLCQRVRRVQAPALEHEPLAHAPQRRARKPLLARRHHRQAGGIRRARRILQPAAAHRPASRPPRTRPARAAPSPPGA